MFWGFTGVLGLFLDWSGFFQPCSTQDGSPGYPSEAHTISGCMDTSVFHFEYAKLPDSAPEVSCSRQLSGERYVPRVTSPLCCFGLHESLHQISMRTSPRLPSIRKLTVFRPVPPRDVKHPPRCPATFPHLCLITTQAISGISSPSSRRVPFPLFFRGSLRFVQHLRCPVPRFPCGQEAVPHPSAISGISPCCVLPIYIIFSMDPSPFEFTCLLSEHVQVTFGVVFEWAQLTFS